MYWSFIQLINSLAFRIFDRIRRWGYGRVGVVQAILDLLITAPAGLI